MSIKTDTFTEVSDTPLESHTSDAGSGWSGNQTTSFTVYSASGTVSPENLNANAATGTEVPSSADYWCEVSGRTNNTTTSRYFGSCVRDDVSGSLTAYLGRVDGGGNWYLIRVLSGSETVLASGTISGFSSTTYYSVKVQAQGTTIKLFIDSVEKASVTDSNITGAGRVGINMRRTEPQITSLDSDYVAAGGLSIPVAMKHYRDMRI